MYSIVNIKSFLNLVQRISHLQTLSTSFYLGTVSQRSRYGLLRFPPNSVDMSTLKYTITKILILAQAQNQFICVKYTSCRIVFMQKQGS